jgi:hypothetical protein
MTNRSSIGIRSLLLGWQSVHFDYVAPGRHVTSDRHLVQIASIPYGSSIDVHRDGALSDDPAICDLYWIEQVIWVDGLVERFNPVRLSSGLGTQRSLVLQSWESTAQQLRSAGEAALLATMEREHMPLRGIVMRTLEPVSIARGSEIDGFLPTHLRWPT